MRVVWRDQKVSGDCRNTQYITLNINPKPLNPKQHQAALGTGLM